MTGMDRLPSLGSRGQGWVVIQFVLLGACAWAGWTMGSLPTDPATWIAATAGIGAITGGLLLAFRGIRGLGDALTPLPYPLDEAGLVESGIYLRVRHPIYGGLILSAVGWALVRWSLAAAALAGVLWLFLWLKSSREETWLLARFPTYSAYRARTPRFIPRSDRSRG
jgi:protein-S-isoprenylcysteine O-methyltransferase Ste14